MSSVVYSKLLVNWQYIPYKCAPWLIIAKTKKYKIQKVKNKHEVWFIKDTVKLRLVTSLRFSPDLGPDSTKLVPFCPYALQIFIVFPNNS